MSKAIVILSDVRVAGQHGGPAHLTYVPAHTINGKPFSQKLTFNVMRNTGRFDATGKEITSSYRMTVWNGLADVCAKYLSIGKGLKFVEGTLDSFQKTLYNADGTMRLGADGQPIKTTMTGISVQDLDFGNDSAKLVTQEIQVGKRGQQWNIAGTPDHAAYQARMSAIKAMVYDGSAPTFGFARVLIPQGAVVNMEVYQKQINKKAGQVQAQNNAVVANPNTQAYTTDQFVNNVQNVANGGVPTPPVQHAAAGSAPLF